MPPETTARWRRLAAVRGCERILSGARPATMREKLAHADLDALPDFYGEDGSVAALEARVAELLGAEAAVLFPSGTMAQQVALRYSAERSGVTAVAVHPLGHQARHERQAYAQLTGLRAVWPTTAPRNPIAEEIAVLDEPVSTVVFELPLRDAGFVLPSWDELAAASAAARRVGARVHLDGARIWESAVHLGRSLDQIAGLADSTYVSFYKSIGGIGGAALAGTAELAGYARAWRHRYGGTLFQQWPSAVTALAGLDRELPRLARYVRHARVVAATLAALPGARVHPEPPHTHQFRLWLPHPAGVLEEAALALAAEEKVWFAGGWKDTELPGTAMAEITAAGPALDWNPTEITEIGTRFLRRAMKAGG